MHSNISFLIEKGPNVNLSHVQSPLWPQCTLTGHHQAYNIEVEYTSMLNNSYRYGQCFQLLRKQTNCTFSFSSLLSSIRVPSEVRSLLLKIRFTLFSTEKISKAEFSSSWFSKSLVPTRAQHMLRFLRAIVLVFSTSLSKTVLAGASSQSLLKQGTNNWGFLWLMY